MYRTLLNCYYIFWNFIIKSDNKNILTHIEIFKHLTSKPSPFPPSDLKALPPQISKPHPPRPILHPDCCPNTEVSNCLASLLYHQSIPPSVRHIKPYAVILTDAPDLKHGMCLNSIVKAIDIFT